MSGLLLAACENKTEENPQICSSDRDCSINSSVKLETSRNNNESNKNINYLILVNKQNKLPDDWESKLDLVEVQNVYDETIKVEREALEKYNELKADLASE
jgi:hypothetical protein